MLGTSMDSNLPDVPPWSVVGHGRAAAPASGLTLLNDEPTAEDELDRERFASTLADIVVSSATPLVVACYGTWGSGKTSLSRPKRCFDAA
jgi:hypothetical protein